MDKTQLVKVGAGLFIALLSFVSLLMGKISADMFNDTLKWVGAATIVSLGISGAAKSLGDSKLAATRLLAEKANGVKS